MGILDGVIVREDFETIFRHNPDLEKLKGTSVLVTGANGMLATYLIGLFLYLNGEKGYGMTVYALTRNQKKCEARFGEVATGDTAKFIYQDVCEPVLGIGNLDYIFHLAGDASPTAIVHDPVGVIRANTLGTMNVLELAKEKQAKLFYASTREVYGKMPEGTECIVEDTFGALDSMESRSCYPESKRMAESLIKSYCNQFGVAATVVRIAHAYGPGMTIQNDGRVMADFIGDTVAGRDIVLKSTGTAVRAFCYISDCIEAILLAALDGESGEAYNIANETEPKEIRDVAKELTELFPEKEIKVVFDIPKEMSAGYSKMGRVKLDTSKMEALGWRPTTKLKDGLRRTVLSFEEV